MSCTRTKIVSLAQEWVGLKESDGSFAKIIDIYNNHKPLARGYKLKLTDAWCAATVSALAITCNATDIIPTEVSCGKLIELAKAMGIWVEADNHIPSPADFILYDWQDTTGSTGENKGNPDHIGIVEKVVGNNITVIEGNYKNAVSRRMIAVNGKFIRGYIVPKYDAEPVKGTKAESGCTVELQVLKKGAKGKNVKAMQTLLIGYGYFCGGYGADGDFGSETETALKSFQKTNKLTPDGICGPKTWAKLLGVSA